MDKFYDFRKRKESLGVHEASHSDAEVEGFQILKCSVKFLTPKLHKLEGVRARNEMEWKRNFRSNFLSKIFKS